MKKIILFCLTLCLCLSVCGCQKKVVNRTYDEGEVLAVSEELIEKSAFFNLVYYGAGIPVKTENPKTTGGYTEADETFLSENGIPSLSALREKTEEVYTKEATDYIFRTVLGVIYDGENIVRPKRYMEADGIFYVLPTAENLLPDTVTYHYDTLAVDHVEGEIIFVTISATVENDEGKTQDRTLSLRLLEEENGFRLDSMTFLNYYEQENKK